MENNTQQVTEVTEIKARPEFLTTLCILSYVGIGYSFISTVTNFFTQGMQKQLMEKSLEMNANNPKGNPLSFMMDPVMQNRAMEYATTSNVVNIICLLICLAGVLLMWKLKKKGYFIYIAGEIFPCIFSFVIFAGSPFGTFIATICSIFAITFIILYGVNLKHMS